MRNVLLAGVDYDGESRELWYSSVEAALQSGTSMLQGDFAWLSFEVWTLIDQWQVVAKG